MSNFKSNILNDAASSFLDSHETGETQTILNNIWDAYMGTDEFNDLERLERANYLFEIRRLIELVGQIELAQVQESCLN